MGTFEDSKLTRLIIDNYALNSALNKLNELDGSYHFYIFKMIN